MKVIKHYTAWLLTFVTLLTAVDLSFIDLSPQMEVFASTTTGSAVDCYDAYDDFSTLKVDISNVLESVRNYLGINDYTSDSASPVNNDLSLNDISTTWSKLNVNTQSTGLYTLEMTPTASAQVKSGNWLTDTKYEAMAGTPTTENLFVTYGGTQWIVDLQYRLVSAPYTRTYHFDASAPNYRYYKLGDPTGGTYSSGLKVDYKAKLVLDPLQKFVAEPVDYVDVNDINQLTSAASFPGGIRFYNYAYLFFEEALPSDLLSGAISGTAHGTETVTTANGNKLKYKADDFTKCEVTRVVDGLNLYGDVDNPVPSDYVTPNMATAILFKQQAYSAIEEFKSVWADQNDNYRADEGTWNDDIIYTEEDKNHDKLSFMYTYAGMARKGTIQGQGSEQKASKGNTTYSDNIWTPTFVSYFYDWDNYTLNNDMDPSYGSDSVKFKTLSESTGLSDSTLRNELTNMLFQLTGSNYETSSLSSTGTEALKAGSSNTQLKGYFDLSLGDLEPGLYEDSGLNLDTASEKLPADLFFACISSQTSGTDVTVALNDIGNAYAFSGPLDNTFTMNLTDSLFSYNTSVLRPGNYDFSQGGWNELAYMYYRAVYSILLNWGQFFYYDEAVALFDGLPGFRSNLSGSEITAYNKKVANNLLACFGSGHMGLVSSHIFVPFASFPRGGDLDGIMENSMNSKLDAAIQNTSPYSVISPALEDSSSFTFGKDCLYGVNLHVSLTTSSSNLAGLDNASKVVVSNTVHGDGTYSGEMLSPFATECTHQYRTSRGHFNAECLSSTELKVECSLVANPSCNYFSVSLGVDNNVCHGTIVNGSCSYCGANEGSTTFYYYEPAIGKYTVDPSDTSKYFGTHICGECNGDGYVVRTQSHETETETLWTFSDLSNVPPENIEVNMWLNVFRPFEQDYTYRIIASHDVEKYIGDWNEIIEGMSNSQKITQSFENVNWVDISSYKLWQLNVGISKGLSSILATPINDQTFQNPDVIVSKAVDKLGYTLYNLSDTTVGNVRTESGTSRVVPGASLFNLQGQGRIANSFYTASQGNLRNVALTQKYSNINNHYGGSHANIYSYRQNDVSLLQVNRPVNNDFSAYYYDGVKYPDVNDDIYFTYYPLKQGGRSHTTFGGFVNQALAHTLYTANSSSGDVKQVPSSYAKFGYSNSMLIQGDYLQLNRSNGTKLSLTGSYYDTWSELKNQTALSGGKFSIVPDGTNDLSKYFSTCTWIPARFDFIYSRVEHDYLYQGIAPSAAYRNPATSHNNIWMIHSYCTSINSTMHGAWDNTLKGPGGGANCDGIDCYTNTFRDLGNVNYTYTGLPKESMAKYGGYGVVSIQDIILDNQSYYTNAKDIEGNYTTVTTMANATILTVPLIQYLNNGTNKSNIMTDLAGVQSAMPYVGYHGTKNGTEDITIEDTDETQLGYSPGYNSNFDVSQAYTQLSGSHKNFKTFGASLKTNPIVVADSDVADNKASGADGFSEKYPWLQGLNVVRSLANGVYDAGDAYVKYTQLASYSSGIAGTKQHSPTDIYVKADYDSISETSNPKLNDIVIYNPIGVESSHLVALSEFMPSSVNMGKDGVYLGSFGESLRNQRVSDRLDVTNDQSGESYLSGSGVLRQSSTASTSTTYEMLIPSGYPTIPYVQSDYEVTTGISEGTFIDDFADTFFINADGVYNMTKFKTNTLNVSGEVSLVKGDEISFYKGSDSAVLLKMGTNNFELTYDSFKEAYSYYEETKGLTESEKWTLYDIGIPLKEGMGLAVSCGTMQLRAGSLLKVTLNFATDESHTATGITNAVNIKPINGCNVYEHKQETSADGKFTTYEWYIEANQDCIVNAINFDVNKDCLLKSFDGNAIYNEYVLLMNLGNSGTITEQEVRSYHFLYGNRDYSIKQTYPTTVINKTLVRERSSYHIEGCVIVNEGFYINVSGATSLVRLGDAALSDPHKVPNTDWRYYVLGWSTSDGHIITDVTDPVLYTNTTKLVRPMGGTADTIYVTVGELMKKVTEGKLGVYRYNGIYGLFDINSDGTHTRTSSYTGITLTNESMFDIISFGDGVTEFVSGLLPLIGTNEEGYKNTTGKSYECVFRATNSTVSIVTTASYKYAAWSVKWSSSVSHKVTNKGDVKDWKEVTVMLPTFEAEELGKIVADTVSLDDEFTIYWDNYGNLSPGVKSTASNLSSVQNALGRGWEVGTSPKDAHAIWSKYADDGTNMLVDTTPWIYKKYVVFNIDMYTFGDNPTYGAYNKDGTRNTVNLVPAGTPIYLGTYENTTAHDNAGRFSDYGAEDVTKDPNGDAYTYHFWCPLSDGETVAGASVHFIVEAINSDINTTDTGDITRYKNNALLNNIANFSKTLSVNNFYEGMDKTNPDSIVKDEWGKEMLDAIGLDMRDNAGLLTSWKLNDDTPKTDAELIFNTTNGYRRYAESAGFKSFSIAGRIGGLTIVDSGDPRYQDTFKLANPNWAWAISPIVRAIESYSNVLASYGAQYKFLSDDYDIRGRLIADNYSYSQMHGSNIYGTQIFFGNGSKYDRSSLPISTDFNIHKEMQSSLQTVKLGYELYCSLETIGNYFGSADKRSETDKTINNNLEYGQTKVQVHPMYIAIPKNPKPGDKPFAVDVYMRKNGSYTLINAGSKYASVSEAGGKDAGPYYLDSAYNATYTSSIDTNSLAVTELDQNLMRRLVTIKELATTQFVLSEARSSLNVSLNKGITKSILNTNNFGTDMIGGSTLNYEYIYGNAQMMFLREYNRTFIGGNSSAIEDGSQLDANAKKYGQKWYFGLGLPSSSVFVPHGVEATEINIISGYEYYILCVIDVYVIGEKWVLNYQSPISKEDLVIGSETWQSADWNVYRETMPYVLPVAIYDITTTSAGDIDSKGSH